MPSLIDKLTELHGKATQGKWNSFYFGSVNQSKDRNDENAIFVSALIDAFPLIKQRFEAMEKLVKQLQQDSDSGDCGYSHTRELAEYREAIKDV